MPARIELRDGERGADGVLSGQRVAIVGRCGMRAVRGWQLSGGAQRHGV